MSGLTRRSEFESERPTAAPTRRLRPVDSRSETTPEEQVRLREETVEQLFRLGGARLVGQLLDLFSSSTPERIELMRQGATGGSAEEAARAAHTLKSSAGNLGAMRMWDLANTVELAAEAGRFDDEYTQAVTDLEHEYAIVEPCLRARLTDAEREA